MEEGKNDDIHERVTAIPQDKSEHKPAEKSASSAVAESCADEGEDTLEKDGAADESKVTVDAVEEEPTDFYEVDVFFDLVDDRELEDFIKAEREKFRRTDVFRREPQEKSITDPAESESKKMSDFQREDEFVKATSDLNSDDEFGSKMTIVPRYEDVNSIIESVIDSGCSVRDVCIAIPANKEFLLALMERGKSEIVSYKIRQFDELGSEIFVPLIEMENGSDIFFENIGRFSGLQLEEVELLLKKDLALSQLLQLVQVMGGENQVLISGSVDALETKKLFEKFVCRFKKNFKVMANEGRRRFIK
jgi:hypothetical protein